MSKITINKTDMKKFIFNPIGEKYAKAMLKFYQQDFDKKSNGSVGYGGIKWEPLSPITVNFKRRMKSRYLDFILKYTGKLRRNLKGKYYKRDTSIRIGVPDDKVPYAKYLNDGTPKMPKRQIFGPLPEQFIKTLEAEIVMNVNELLKATLNQIKSSNIKVRHGNT